MPALLIGQDAECEIRVADPYVSGRHARITTEPGGDAWIEDLGSTNGTFIEYAGVRRRVHGPTLLQSGDIVWLGWRTRLTWRASTPAPAPPPRPAGEAGNES